MVSFADLPKLKTTVVEVDGVEVKITELNARGMFDLLNADNDLERMNAAAYHGAMNGEGRLFDSIESLDLVPWTFVQELAEKVIAFSGIEQADDPEGKDGG